MNKSRFNILVLLIISTFGVMILSGCAKSSDTTVDEAAIEQNENTDNSNADSSVIVDESTPSDEIQNNAQDKLAGMMSSNEDVFAWITVDGTNIDGPVLQSWEEDDYYASHNDQKRLDSNGAMYIEMANMANMCDFNTVIHGSGGEQGIFAELVNFENPDFFEKHEEFVIYLPDNKLTYEIWAVFERDNTSLIREYDFTYQSGCRQFLDDVYGDKVMGKQIRGGWGDVNENMFMVTLTVDNPDSDKQLVVIGALVDDEAGTIDRIVSE